MTPEHQQQMMEQMSQMRAEMDQMNAQMSQMKEKCKTMMGHGATGSSDNPAGTNHQQHQQGNPNHSTGH
jgi:type II secretory pathway component PulM